MVPAVFRIPCAKFYSKNVRVYAEGTHRLALSYCLIWVAQYAVMFAKTSGLIASTLGFFKANIS